VGIFDRSTPSLTKADGTRTPVGELAGYSVTGSAIPVDPRDSSGQVPTFGATLTNVEGDPKSLVEQNVTLTDWTRTVTTGRVAAVSRAVESGVVSLDANTIFERLNTEQTCLPIVLPEGVGSPVTMALEHWMLMAGVPRRAYEGNLKLCLQANWTENYGYIANSNTKLRRIDQTQAQYTPYIPTIGTYLAPLEINAAQSTVLAAQFWHNTGLQESRLFVEDPKTETSVRYTLGRNGTTYYFKQKIGSGTETTLLTTTYTPTQGADVFVFLKLAAGNTSTNVTMTMRFMEYNTTAETTSYSDVTVSNFSAPILRSRPKPTKLEVGWDQSLQTLGVPSGSAPESFVITDVMPTVVPKSNTSFNLDFTADTMKLSQVPGFTGNVWDKIREFCSLLEIDVFFKGDFISFESRVYRRKDYGGNYVPALALPKSNLTESVSSRETARSVEVVYRLMDGTYYVNYAPGNSLLWKADSVYSLEKGERKVEVVQTDASIVYTNQPVAVSGVPVPYTSSFGSYVIWGNDGYVVDPQWWKDNGGSITVQPTGVHGEIELTFQAPNVDTVRAPYRVSEGTADRPALYIMGKGLKMKPEKVVKVYTGYPEASQDVGAKLDSPFVVTKLMALNAGNKLANGYGSTDTTLSFQIGQSEKEAPVLVSDPLTYLNNSVYWAGSHYRIEEQTVTHGQIDVSTARRHNTIAGVNGEFSTGKTIADWNALHSGKVIRDTNIAPLPRYVG
jgi:hypothetical protein